MSIFDFKCASFYNYFVYSATYLEVDSQKFWQLIFILGFAPTSLFTSLDNLLSNRSVECSR